METTGIRLSQRNGGSIVADMTMEMRVRFPSSRRIWLERRDPESLIERSKEIRA